MQKNFKGGFDFQDWIVEFLLGGVKNPKRVADGGWDGYLTFYKSENKKGRALIEVKSGAVGVKNAREFVNVVSSQKADLGILVCFKDEVTAPMEAAAKDAEKYKPYKIDRVQILTVEGLLEGDEPKIPGGAEINVFKAASTDVRSMKSDQSSLDF